MSAVPVFVKTYNEWMMDETKQANTDEHSRWLCMYVSVDVFSFSPRSEKRRKREERMARRY